MDSKPIAKTDPKAPPVPDLPLAPGDAAKVKGGKLYEQCTTGTHIKAVTIETSA